jgi:hypothetical protein
MDGMIETQDVSRQNIDIRINNGNKEWVAKAHRIGSDGMLGFIRFDKLRGTLELTNFNAKLPPESAFARRVFKAKPRFDGRNPWRRFQSCQSCDGA